MKEKKQLTISSLAEKCGVSRMVVSSVLFPRESVSHIKCSKETKQKILDTAERLNFRANRTWRNATNKRHGSFGVLVKNIYNIPGVGNVSKIVNEAQKHNLLVSFDVIHDDNQLPLFLKEDVVDGILMFEDLGKPVNDAISTFAIPTVWINANNKNTPCVRFDDVGGMESLVKLFTKKGKKNIAVFIPNENWTINIRKKSLLNAAKNNNLPEPKFLTILDWNKKEDYARMEKNIFQFMKQNPEIDAVIVQLTLMAFPLYRICSRLKKEIPRDIAVAGMHDTREAFNLMPNLTVLKPKEQSEIIGTRMLCKMLKGENLDQKNILIPYNVIEQGST